MSPIRPLQAQIFIRVHCKRKILHARYSLLARLPCAYSGRLQDSASLTRLNGSVLICNCLNVVLCLLFGTRRPKRPLTALGNSGLPNLCVVLLEPIASALDVSDTSFGTLSVRNATLAYALLLHTHLLHTRYSCTSVHCKRKSCIRATRKAPMRIQWSASGFRKS